MNLENVYQWTLKRTNEYNNKPLLKGLIAISITFPVRIEFVQLNYPKSNVFYPQIIDMSNYRVKQMINQTILQHVILLIERQKKEQSVPVFDEMIGSFEIKNNSRNILSITLTNYAYAHHHAHGLTIMSSVTFNTQTGKLYKLSDLFKHNSPYVEVLSQMVKDQISKRQIELIHPFSGISPNQKFYIADKTLVLYYQLYEITPYVFGFPIFPISVYDISDIISKTGPLGLMASNT